MKYPSSQKELMQECTTGLILSFEASILLMRNYQHTNLLPSGMLADFLNDMKKRQNLTINGCRRAVRELDCSGPWGKSYEYLGQLLQLVEAIN